MTEGLDLRLLGLIGPGGRAVAVTGARAGEVTADSDAVISVRSGGREHLGTTLSWGPIGRVAAQFEPAAQRLERGALAMIRSARLDISAGICLVVETARDAVTVSLGAVEELPFRGWFPDDPAFGEQLVAHVAAHRDAVVDAATRHLSMEPAHGSRARFVHALRREAASAAALDRRRSTPG